MSMTNARRPKDDRATPTAFPAMLACAGLFAVTMFAWITRRMTTCTSQPFDNRMRENVQVKRTKAGDMIAQPLTILSMPGVVVPASLGVAWTLYRQDRHAAALAVALAPAIAMTTGQSCTMFLPQRNAPNSENARGAPEPSFPSGHTTGVTAEALSMAYVLTREHLVSPRTIAVLLGWPLAVGAVRLYRDRHWASDVLAGWSAGIAVAALCGLIYEQRRQANDTQRYFRNPLLGSA